MAQRGGQQQEIYCAVSNCHYYQSGHKCRAEKIMVCSDPIAHKMPDTMDATTSQQFPESPCNSCMETACKTFVAKEDPTRDGVNKL